MADVDALLFANDILLGSDQNDENIMHEFAPARIAQFEGTITAQKLETEDRVERMAAIVDDCEARGVSVIDQLEARKF